MPPEPLPLDRKEFSKEKKHERSDAIGSFTRWRDSHHGSRESVRWAPDEFRRPPGHGKQGGYQLFSEETGHGCLPSWSSDRMVEDESCRPAASRGDGKYGRNSRENKASFSPKDWKGHPSETGDASVNLSGRQHDVSAQRSASDLLTHASHPHSENENSSWDQLHFKDQHDKMSTVDVLGTGHRYDKDHSLGSITWKPMKWTRSSSLSSRGSGFSHSSSSRSNTADFDETKHELLPGKVTAVQSPSGDASGGVTSATQFEETCSRKRQRLGWGQGLAKYEKKKVEGPDESVSRNELVLCADNPKTSHSLIPNWPDKSPKGAGLSECASPATPSSVACSSSSGLEDKPYIKAANSNNDTTNLSGSPGHGFQNCLEEFSVDLEQLELNSITNLSSLLIDLLQPEDASSGDSNFVRSTVMNKLLLLKSDVLKALEKTECEIDLYETELKSLNSESETSGPCLTVLESLQLYCASKPCEQETRAVSKVFQKPAPLKLVSSGDMLVEKPLVCNDSLDELRAEVKDEDADSPGTATSKFVEPLSMEKAISASDMVENNECRADFDAVRSKSPEGQCIIPPFDEKKSTSVSGSQDWNHLNESSTGAHVSTGMNLHTDLEHVQIDLILASNRDSARKAYEIFGNLLPTDTPQIDIWETSKFSFRQNDSLIKAKLNMRKCSLRFKERVLSLKFRALQHLWKEDMRLLSIRKYRAKSQKRLESSSRASYSGYQKHRSSIRSRFTLPAGNLTLVPTAEIVDYTSKLLSDSQIKLYGSSLKMPALILDEKEKRLSRFVTSNGLVEDPCAVEKEREMINPWMPNEKEIFMEMISTFGKDFKKIASFLDHKTTADCIEFYYKNQKSESFEKIKKKLELRKQGRSLPTNTYLVTSGKNRNRELNAASLDMLGAASVIAAHADDSMKAQQTCVGKSFLGGHHNYKSSWGDDGVLERSSSVDIFGNERESAAADVLAGICGALSSEAMSSCVTSSVDPGEGCQELKCQKRDSVMDRPLTPEVAQTIDDEETFSDDSCGELDSVDWTDDEKSIFIQALRSYGKDFAKISRCVGTRSRDQCNIFFSKARKCLGLDMIHPVPGNEGMPVSDTNGGRSDTEDACIVEMESAICSTQSCTRMDVDLPLPLTNTNCGPSGRVGTTHLQTEPDRLGRKNGIDRLNLGDAETGIETIAPDDCWAGVRPELVFDGEQNLVKEDEAKFGATQEVLQFDGAVTADAALSCELPMRLCGNAELIAVAEAENEQGTCQTVTSAEEYPSAEGPVDLGQSSSNTAVGPKAVAGASAEGLKTESDRRDSKNGADANGCRSSSCCLLPAANTNRNVSHVAVEKTVHPSFSLTPNYKHQISSELLPSVQKSRIISWQPENCPSVSACSLLQDSSVVHSEDHLQQATPSSVLNFGEHGNKQHEKSSGTDVSQQYLLGHHCLKRFESSQILKGYPLRVLNKKETSGDAEDLISSEKLSMVQNFSKVKRNSQLDQFFAQDFYYNEKCDGSKPLSVAELPLLSNSLEQSSDRPRSHSRSSSDAEELSRKTGDVKLFGQILSHPSPLQKPISTTQETVDKGPSPSNSSSKSFNSKFTTDNGMDGTLVPSKLDTSNYSGLEDYPMSYGFWDGNRIQTRLSSLPDSAILLAKYPAAFGDFTASCRRDKQPLPAVVKRKDRNVGYVSVGSNAGLKDYQVYRGYDGTKVQPFTVDVKRHDIFSELQKRKGFETVSGFQQQGRGVVGMNVMGGGILVGGPCTGVSDPVAAIKMHYATTERFGGQAGSIRDEESWRGGDRGR